ncbi:hypothetical protein [Dechloromonas sp. HYN0024]|uniref:hypothetical protein n=1 Tax=Dechloromonas sp. HYN0024 TaxID=2231055 RepID=UPI0013C30E69|nr:hypothetical protein [Dechloromonas sp. HYN0024]
MATAENITPSFCRINTLLNLMAQDIKAHNNTDFDVLEALLPAVQGEIDSLWRIIEKDEVAA